MLSHNHSKASVLILLITCCLLVACVSPREKSQALTERILDHLPVPDGAILLHSSEFENISRTGMGTHFGVRGLYGFDTEYSLIVEQYRELLSAEGWVEFGLTAGGNPLFCNPDYDAVRLSLADSAGLEEGVFAIPANMLSEYRATYHTLYVVTLSHFPFDETGTCRQVD